MRLLWSWTLQEPQIERREHQDDSDVHHQPLPESVPEEQDVYPDHDGYQREHVKHDGCLSSHSSILLLRPRRASREARDDSRDRPDPQVYREIELYAVDPRERDQTPELLLVLRLEGFRVIDLPGQIAPRRYRVQGPGAALPGGSLRSGVSERRRATRTSLDRRPCQC